MHTFYFPKKTAWISSGSNLVTGVTQTDQNFGQDEILELKKFLDEKDFKNMIDISSIIEQIVNREKNYILYN